MLDPANQSFHHQHLSSQLEILRLHLRLILRMITWMALRRFSLISQRRVAQDSQFTLQIDCHLSREKTMKPIKSERGQSLVELAISIVILIYLLAGAVEFGLAFFQFVQLRDAAQEGALYGSMNPLIRQILNCACATHPPRLSTYWILPK